MGITPLSAILLVLWLNKQTTGQELDIASTFTVVSIIGSLKKPLRRFMGIIDRYYEYVRAKKSLNRLLFLIPDKPFEAIEDKNLATGEIIFKNCQIQTIKDRDMKKALSKIFGDEIDMEEENQTFAKSAKKRKMEKRKKKKKRYKVSGSSKVNIEIKQKEGEENKQEEEEETEKSEESEDDDKFPSLEKSTLVYNYNLKIQPKSNVFLINAPPTKSKKIQFDHNGRPIEPRNTHPHDLIFSLLGENYLPNEQSCRYKGKIVYSNSKNPSFLGHQSLRDNVLFGEIMIKDRYKEVMEKVGLDLTDFPGGDQFQIFEKGANLNSTELQKILLARMMYMSGDIYILEGFFDKVGKVKDKENMTLEEKMAVETWGRLLGPGGFLRFKTTIIVEDMKGKLENADLYKDIMSVMDQILVFGSERGKNGAISSGIETFLNYEDYDRYIDYLDAVEDHGVDGVEAFKRVDNLQKSGTGYKELKSLKTTGGSEPESAPLAAGGINIFSMGNLSKLKGKQTKDPFAALNSQRGLRVVTEASDNGTLQDKLNTPGGKILLFLAPGILKVVKRKSEGMVSNDYNNDKIYAQLSKSIFKYMYGLGKCRIYVQFFFFAITTASFLCIDVYTGMWSSKKLNTWSATRLLLTYLGLSIFVSLLAFLSDISFTNVIKKNAHKLHKLMVLSLMNIYLQWFTTNYEAEIDYLLSADMRKVDTKINFQLENMIESLTFVIAGLLVLNYIYWGLFSIVTILVFLYLHYILKNLFKTIENLVKFIAENEASFQDVMNLTIEEIFKYRVMNKESILEKKFDYTTNQMQRAMSHVGMCCKRWIGVRLGWVNTFLLSSASESLFPGP